MPFLRNYRYILIADRLITVIVAVFPLLLTYVCNGNCQDSQVYFPMPVVKFNLPFNEKSQSIFSKIPIGHFHLLPAGMSSVRRMDFIYTLEQNELLRVNASTGEVFMKNDYKNAQNRTKITLTAMESNGKEALYKLPRMTLEVTSQEEDIYCRHLENICFWTSAEYTIFENVNESAPSGPGTRVFEPLRVGALNPRATRYLCPTLDVKYTLLNGGKYFMLKNNELYTKVQLDYENFNATELANFTVTIDCAVKVSAEKVVKFNKTLHVALKDRNDNGPQLQNEKDYYFKLDNPHFKENDSVGTKINFTDKDSLLVNAYIIYQIANDTNNLVRPECTASEKDHNGKRRSIFSCQLFFARNGILGQPLYCFSLIASDSTIDGNPSKTATANICIGTDSKKIHKTERLHIMKPHQQNSEDRRFSSSTEYLLDHAKRIFLPPSVLVTYPKDVYIYRSSRSYSRVAQPEILQSLIDTTEVKFTIAEDRSGAFGVTPTAGIIYVKRTKELEQALETVYFVNITWHDAYQRAFVVNVHLVNGNEENITCHHKLKSRSQTCAQVKYHQQCKKFCGLGTNGTACSWRGSHGDSFGRNYASCVADDKHCPDNICDPLEELNTFICPQDCVAGGKVLGRHSTNNNRRGIYAALGTCTCEDSGKCVCEPLDVEELRPKRKRKNETKTADVNKFVKSKGFDSALPTQIGVNTNDALSIHVAGFTCGKSCILLVITTPFLITALIICLIVSQRNYLRRTSDKTDLAHIAANDDCDASNGVVSLIQLEGDALKFNKADSKWEFERAKLELDTVLGEGEFGKVVKGYAKDIADVLGVTTVAVKMLKNGANSVEYMALMSEFQLLQEVSHPNVIKLLGACTKDPNAPMIIMEFAKYGSLRSYLRLSRKIKSLGIDYADGIEPVTVKHILSFAWQICKGMTYLTDIKLVHRDLAARNVLLADGKICKISDFGLTRDVYEEDTYLKRSPDKVPVKWMAPESLADHVYTSKSDVWSFGVLCWELVTLGASPYPGIPPQDLYHLLKSGYRMERPDNCAEDIFKIIRTCWSNDPNTRPSFRNLATQFEKLLGNNGKFIEMETSAISNPIYCLDDTTLSGAEHVSKSELLEHLWQPPNDIQERKNSLEFSAFHQPPPGYDVPRPITGTANAEQMLRYHSDLRFPLNIRNSSSTSNSQNCSNGSGGDDGVMEDGVSDHYSVLVKRGRSNMDMTNKSDNFENLDFEKHLSKTISFRFPSLLNLKEKPDQD